MREGIRIGRLFGVDVVIDNSWIFVFLLMSWNLTVVFGRWHEAWPPGASLALAVLAAFHFFASVVLHEFAHALVAGTFGMKVTEIRLFLFGGISQIWALPGFSRLATSLT